MNEGGEVVAIEAEEELSKDVLDCKTVGVLVFLNEESLGVVSTLGLQINESSKIARDVEAEIVV